MNFSTIKILIAAAFIVIASSMLSACSPRGGASVGVERLEEAQTMKKSVSVSLSEVPSEDNLIVRIALLNPEKKPLTSAQLWLTYNPDHLKGVKVDTDSSAFEMTAPYDNTFDHEAGFVMLGRSNTVPVDDAEIVFADVHFEKLTDGVAMIEAYDYKQDLSGHSSVNMMLDGTPLNILLKPESPLFVIQ